MPRIRTIKPEFWTDEKLTECSLVARLLFIGMLNFADDNGNLVYSVKRLKMQIFPADNVDVGPLLAELIAQDVITEYSVSGEKLLHIKGFLKHQVINRPSATTIPRMPISEHSRTDANKDVSNHALLSEPSVSAHAPLNDRSLTEGKGKEEEGKGKERIQEQEQKQRAPEIPVPISALATKAMIDAGLSPSKCNPSDPRLAAAIAEGVTPQMLADITARAIALKTSVNQGWVVATARGQLADSKVPIVRSGQDSQFSAKAAIRAPPALPTEEEHRAAARPLPDWFKNSNEAESDVENI